MNDQLRLLNSVSPTQNNILMDCLKKQIDELDMLQSIFCNSGEFQIEDHSATADINEYLLGNLQELTQRLEYSIYFKEANGKIEIKVILPNLYPTIEVANVSVKSCILNKNDETLIKREIENFIKNIDKTESYMYQVISWIQENIDAFKNLKPIETNLPEKVLEIELQRLWIYSHHIKSKTKRINIVNNAKILNLTGFCKPGKPGIICVEGYKEDTEEFWKLLKGMNWQKITVKKSEDKTCSIEKIDKFRIFQSFNEEIFIDIGDEQEVKMNMSVFLKYLEQHNCSYMKKYLFNFE